MNNIDQNKNSVLPIEFIALVQDALPVQAEILLESIQHDPPSLSIRLHPHKGADLHFTDHPVSWCPLGQYLQDRPVFTLDPLFQAGAYYVQEASSMVLCHVLSQLQLPESPAVLDLCAAPGGKSTLLLDFLNGKGHLVANEVIKSRAAVLVDNLVKWGYANCCITNNDPKDFTQLENHFDLILVDAPCSGEGMFRKDHNAIAEWSIDNVALCAGRQQRIIDDVLPALKEGGYLIYSTCTFNQQENISNVAEYVEKYKLRSVEIELPAAWNMVEISAHNCKGYQCVPGFTRGEGYFFSVLQKPMGNNDPDFKQGKAHKLRTINKAEKSILDLWINPDYLTDVQIHENGDVYYFPTTLTPFLFLYLKMLHVKNAGIKLGKLNKTVFTPDHSVALTHLPILKSPKIELSKDDALRYLNKTLSQVNHPHNVWLVVTYQNLGLGWIKNLGNRINNYLPAHLRIHMDIGIR
ncbi:MAG TPA: hypothetical protein PKA12_07920 [Saprospiraceae bacterium]|nr:hypothetical protein [Saprospiraceae bacterium]